MNSNPLSGVIETSFSHSDILWLLWYVAALVFTVHAIIIIYHWFTYGTTKRIPMFVATIYVVVGIGILAAAAGIIYFAF